MSIYRSVEYGLVREMYGRSVAERSQKPLIDHIDEGLVILSCLGASDHTRQAWCLHPLIQSDENLSKFHEDLLDNISTYAFALAMEYRYRANSWLSDKVFINPDTNSCQAVGKPEWSLPATKNMLIADKVQNYKDFCTYHPATHPRSRELNFYFLTWLDALEVTPEQLKAFYAAIDTKAILRKEEHDVP